MMSYPRKIRHVVTIVYGIKCTCTQVHATFITMFWPISLGEDRNPELSLKDTYNETCGELRWVVDTLSRRFTREN